MKQFIPRPFLPLISDRSSTKLTAYSIFSLEALVDNFGLDTQLTVMLLYIHTYLLMQFEADPPFKRVNHTRVKRF